METPALTRKDWLDHALQTLKSQGFAALKAQPLAKSLNVTRGSFYHHFSSLEDFHRAVIAHWAETTSGPVIDEAQRSADPAMALDRLLHTTLRSGADLERAVRSWSTVDTRVAAAVAAVDATRIAAAEAVLTAAGLPAPDANARAKLLYWAAIGRLMVPFPSRNILPEDQITALSALMRSQPTAD